MIEQAAKPFCGAQEPPNINPRRRTIKVNKQVLTLFRPGTFVWTQMLQCYTLKKPVQLPPLTSLGPKTSQNPCHFGLPISSRTRARSKFTASSAQSPMSGVKSSSLHDAAGFAFASNYL